MHHRSHSFWTTYKHLVELCRARQMLLKDETKFASLGCICPNLCSLKIDRWSARPQCHACHCASGVNLTWLPLLKELLDNNQYFNAVLVACKSDSNHSRVVRKPISTATHSCPSTATHSCPSTTTHSYPSTATHSCPSLLREGKQGRRL